LSWRQEFSELKRLNADALPFDLHRDEFQTSTTSPGLSTDDDDDEDHVDSEDGKPDSATLTLTSQPDAIPDLIPNQRATTEEVADRGGSGGLEHHHPPSYTSLHNGRSDDLGRSSPLNLQKSTKLSLALFVI